MPNIIKFHVLGIDFIPHHTSTYIGYRISSNNYYYLHGFCNYITPQKIHKKLIQWGFKEK